MTEQDDLERRVRASLDARASEVDTSVPVVARARAAARKHRGRWVALGAAVAVAAVAITAVVVDRADPPSSEEPPVATPSATQSAVPDDRRTEYWHDVSVQVPADWGWGTAPMTLDWDSDGGAVLCGGPGAMRTAEGKDLVRPDPAAPYIGRPIMLSDVCGGGALTNPAAPYVWFDASVEPGSVNLRNGYVQDTVEVDGTTVTVGSDDQTLRERILASVARQDLCPATVDAAGLDLGSAMIDGVPAARLCAYALEDGGHELVYGRQLDPATFARFDRAVDRAPEDSRRCKGAGDLVVFSGTSDTDGAWPATRTWAADLACDTLASSFGVRSLTINVMETFADPGLRSTLPAFIGYQG